jgi:hypothetical protein
VTIRAVTILTGTIKMMKRVGCGLLLASLVPLGLQAQDNVPVPAVTGVQSGSEDRMTTPPPVSGQEYPVRFSSETQENYLRGGIIFTGAYSDNVLTSAAGNPQGDLSFSIGPTIAIDQTRPRLHWNLSYAPGFTFYRRFNNFNEADQNLRVDFEYELTPHVTFSVRDTFQKASSVFNSPDQSLSGTVSGATVGSSSLVVAPLADRLNNTGNVGLTYQFAANGMMGVSGTFYNLHYPNASEVTPANPTPTSPTPLFGLYDSSTRTGSAFYSARFSKKNYLGVTYEYDDLFSYPTGLTTETQTHSVYVFYTFRASTDFSVSLFGGPQHSHTTETAQPASQSWNPAAGASLNWGGRRSALAVSYARTVTGGGGLIGAGLSNVASASARLRITKNVSGSVDGSYNNRNMIQLVGLPNMSGHAITGDVSLERRMGAHLAARAGYTRLHQQYQDVTVIAPNTNREWISLSYEFSRPLGR